MILRRVRELPELRRLIEALQQWRENTLAWRDDIDQWRGTATTALQAHASRLTTLETWRTNTATPAVQSLSGRVTVLETTVADHETRLVASETTATDHEARLVALETPAPPPGG